MLDLKKWIAKVSAALSNIPTFDWSKSNQTDGGYSVNNISIAASGYLGQNISLGSKGDKKPILNGWDISGTGTARCQTIGAYLWYDASGWHAYLKYRNDGNALTGVTMTVYVVWV